MPSSPSFCDAELLRALNEQSFGIKSFTVSSSSPQQAIATIVLLDGPKLTVQLTTQGYSVVSTTKVYETIEDLLQASSPMYDKRRQEALYAKLSKLSS
ncbi:hypothetical protein BDN70DRAFT_799882 [Pholiota conissans]|uniref:GSKIP domain-containing protein n=1 Tax=Pholiota conissans TaxID=109636 RepID=A0A9P5ZAN8_9AGAR|nr:hypothetical protein BDN70DRAFT_799882 [Pholiota conissans]